MVHISASLVSLAVSLFAGGVLAHPGHHGTTEMKSRAEYMANAKRTSLSHCADVLKARGTMDKIVERRQNKVEQIREKRGIKKRSLLKARDFDDVLNTDHESNLTGITPETDPAAFFGDLPSCVLSPEVTEGPYYVSGETVRTDMTEGQGGVELYVDVMVMDTETCEPLTGVALDFWACNSTGVYSGVVAGGNGNEADESNLQNKALRGIQFSDEDGVIDFLTIFPGHYTGRTNHIHVMSHLSAEQLDNGTITSGQISHVGQLFFDQDLIDLVETASPYSTNTQEQMLNVDDGIMEQESATSDPVVSYVLLGDTIEEGVFSWISFGVDTSVNKTVNAASSCYAEGCVANENSGGPGGPPPNATFPSGFPTPPARK
ncbi:putative extracellular dioxygenase [Diplodia seriata]|uniref:Putative extracellular dioxygenase n=1 Tax=Diplodia seriata TaxID=420778 RepID=A0A0G2E7K5_9PEZI|nr:putative extracellular dioxygenase [Diplodia seriata]